jgi:TetR/AcrR family transcriptional regulator, regulator of mycofactocin system
VEVPAELTAPVEPRGLRERKKQRTRALIASVALELFGQRGYSATTVADIAAAAEVSERTVFTYFPTKEDILFSDHAVFRERLTEALERRPAGTSVLDTLRDFVIENLSAIDEASRVRWEIVSHDEHLLSHQRARQVELGDTIAAAVAEELGDELGSEPGEGTDDFRLQLVTAAVVAAVTAVYEHRNSVRSRTASRAQALAVIDEAIAFLRGGLAAIRAFPKPY